MKLSTQKIFKTLKNSPKRKPRISHKSKFSSQYVSINKISKNTNNTKRKLFLNTTESENPFSKPKNRNSIMRTKTSKNALFKSPKFEFNIFKTQNDLFKDEDSYINNILLTSESDSNKYENDIKDEKTVEQEYDFDTLHKIFKKSSLKSTIIIDNKGNNNLNSEQKEIIGNYFNFNKKNTINSVKKVKINTIPIQIYKENNTLFSEKKPVIKSNSRNKINVYNFNSKDLKSFNEIENKKIVHKKIYSTKEAIKTSDELEEKFGLKLEKNKINEIDNNSIFENYTNKSIDSSFLGSSLDDDFYQDLSSKK